MRVVISRVLNDSDYDNKRTRLMAVFNYNRYQPTTDYF